MLFAVLASGCESATASSPDPEANGGSGSASSPPTAGQPSSGGATSATGATGATLPAGGGAGNGGSSSGGAAAGNGEAPAVPGGMGGSASNGSAGAAGTPTAGQGGALPAAPYGCTGCQSIFDGKSLQGWVTTPGAWEAKDGVLASTGKNGDIWTEADYDNYRIFFQVRQVKGDHKPCTVFFGTRPAGTSGRGLGGAQFQPPNGASWDYGIGGEFVSTQPEPRFDVSQWHQCEVQVKLAGDQGSFRAACCPVGNTPCKSQQVLSWKGKGHKHPFDIMMHNPGLFDEYRELWLEQNPPVDELLSMR